MQTSTGAHTRTHARTCLLRCNSRSICAKKKNFIQWSGRLSASTWRNTQNRQKWNLDHGAHACSSVVRKCTCPENAISCFSRISQPSLLRHMVGIPTCPDPCIQVPGTDSLAQQLLHQQLCSYHRIHVTWIPRKQPSYKQTTFHGFMRLIVQEHLYDYG